jgi:hypothetical protein
MYPLCSRPHHVFDLAHSDIPLIERRLRERGCRMEGSLSSLDGQLDGIVDLSTGDPLEDPDDEILALAGAWTLLHSQQPDPDHLEEWASAGYSVWVERLRRVDGS